MALIKARSLSEYREDEQDFAGRATRRARRRYRKARRAKRDQDKARELREKARGLEKHGKGGKKRGKKDASDEASEPRSGPRRFPGGFPGRGLANRQDDEAPDGADAETQDGGEEPDPEEVFPEDGAEDVGWSPRRTRVWGPLVGLGRNLRVQAAAGYRAAIIALRPGLFLVAEIPEQTTRTEIGVVPLLAPLLLRSAGKALLHRNESAPANPAAAAPTTTALTRASPPEAVPATGLGWADPEDVAAVLGCDRCDTRRRR